MITAEEVFSYDNLLEAYYHCKKNKSTRAAVVRYHISYITNLYKLQERILAGKYEINELRTFVVYEPKKRYVTANDFEDKIVQRVICKHVLEPIIEPTLIPDNVATRKGKGTHYGVKRLQKHMRAYVKTVDWTDAGHVMSGDISKYFYTINKDVCYKMIERLPIDDILKDIIKKQIYAYDVSLNEYSDDPNHGICIGFQTSQWLAVWYLNSLDHFVKEKLHIKYYGRYMDDFYLIHKDRKYLEYCMEQIRLFVEGLGLKLNPKSHIHEFKQGICYLGYHCTFNTKTHQIDTVVRSKSIKRMKKRLKRQLKLLEVNKMTIEKAVESLNSWATYASHGDTDKAYNAYHEALRKISPHAYEWAIYEEELKDPRKVDQDGFYILEYKEGFNTYPIPNRIRKSEAERDLIEKNNYNTLKYMNNHKGKPKRKKKDDPDLTKITTGMIPVAEKWAKTKTDDKYRDDNGFIRLVRRSA